VKEGVPPMECHTVSGSPLKATHGAGHGRQWVRKSARAVDSTVASASDACSRNSLSCCARACSTASAMARSTRAACPFLL
jgi:hypothetical protein